MSYETTIGAFAAALADPAAPLPGMTQGRLGAPDARRFSVYRNNVAVGLIGALEARYPVSRRMMGADLFRAMARAFARAHKPRSPVMIAYGGDFPDFVAASLAVIETTADDLTDVPDVARLENAWVEAYHAEDAPVAAIGDLGKLDPAALPRTRVEFHPAAFLLRFATPAASIWAAHQSGARTGAPARRLGEDALVTRPGQDVSVRVLPPSGYEFAASLRGGATLIEAAEAVNVPDFDFGAHLVGLVESGAVASIINGEPT
jgi:hypothetical protein